MFLQRTDLSFFFSVTANWGNAALDFGLRHSFFFIMQLYEVIDLTYMQRVSELYNSSASKCDIKGYYLELSAYLKSIKSISNNDLLKLVDEGKFSRCFEVCWCSIPQDTSHKMKLVLQKPFSNQVGFL